VKIKKEVLRDISLILVSVLLGILFIQFVDPHIELESVEENIKLPEPLPENKDFPSIKEGTFVGTINGNNVVNYKKIILFQSAKISGLTLAYYPEKMMLFGGTPEMKAENINLFDGQVHQIAYTFKRFDKQKLYFDGVLVAESNFNSFPRHLSGLVTGVEKVYVSNLFDEVIIS
jgi:hypothetical protein